MNFFQIERKARSRERIRKSLIVANGFGVVINLLVSLHSESSNFARTVAVTAGVLNFVVAVLLVREE